jgi:hypothetical protein
MSVRLDSRKKRRQRKQNRSRKAKNRIRQSWKIKGKNLIVHRLIGLKRLKRKLLKILRTESRLRENLDLISMKF